MSSQAHFLMASYASVSSSACSEPASGKCQVRKNKAEN